MPVVYIEVDTFSEISRNIQDIFYLQFSNNEVNHKWCSVSLVINANIM